MELSPNLRPPAVRRSAQKGELRYLESELARTCDMLVESWVSVLHRWDTETAGHTRRVTSLTLRLARSIGVSRSDVAHIRRGAMLHDIGKLWVPDSILRKRGPLTDAEWEVMRLHPIYAYNLISAVDLLRPAVDIPYSHHERWDGSGYPAGTAGGAIPLAARIFAVVDVWDALRYDRPYRSSWPPAQVRDYIAAHAGTQFDPQVVEAFLRLGPS